MPSFARRIDHQNRFGCFGEPKAALPCPSPPLLPNRDGMLSERAATVRAASAHSPPALISPSELCTAAPASARQAAPCTHTKAASRGPVLRRQPRGRPTVSWRNAARPRLGTAPRSPLVPKHRAPASWRPQKRAHSQSSGHPALTRAIARPRSGCARRQSRSSAASLRARRPTDRSAGVAQRVCLAAAASRCRRSRSHPAPHTRGGAANTAARAGAHTRAPTGTASLRGAPRRARGAGTRGSDCEAAPRQGAAWLPSACL